MGEEVVTIDGQIWRLTSITPRAGPETVYNFEVAGEHVYYVTSNGLLAHNACSPSWLRSAFGAIGRGVKYVARRIEIYRRAKRIFKDSRVVTSYARRAPDIVSRRWVQLGKASWWNYLKTGLWGPKVHLKNIFRKGQPVFEWGKRFRDVNYISRRVNKSEVKWPSGLDFWRGLFGQRQMK